MKLKDFAQEVSELEKGKRQVDITQINEMLKVINKLTFRLLYFIIWILPNKK